MAIEIPDLIPEHADRWKALMALGTELPSRPELLDEMRALVDRPNFRIGQLAALVKRDPGLTARLFEVINSPAFGVAHDVESVDEALAILGLGPAMDLFTGILLRKALGSHPALDLFWTRSTLIAELAAIIAQRQAVPVSANVAYLAGLFHAVGAAMLMRAKPAYAAALTDNRGWCDLQRLDLQYGYDYAFAGYVLCCKWRLPVPVTEAVLRQGDVPGNYPPGSGLVAVLHLAVYVYNRVFVGEEAASWPNAQPDVLEILGMTEADLQAMA